MKTSEPIEPTELIACLCEGGAEKAIVNRLLDSKMFFLKCAFFRETYVCPLQGEEHVRFI